MNEKVMVVPDLVRVHLIPKVASSTLHKAMGFDKRAYLVPATEDGDEYRWKVVRHPLDRLVSIYSYFCAGTGLAGQPQVAKLGYHKGQNFQDFLDVVCDRHWENIHTRMQCEFEGPRPADYYADYSHLEDEWRDFQAMFPDLKAMVHLPVIHKTDHKPWEQFYNDSQRCQAEQTFAKDLELYSLAKKD